MTKSLKIPSRLSAFIIGLITVILTYFLTLPQEQLSELLPVELKPFIPLIIAILLFTKQYIEEERVIRAEEIIQENTEDDTA